MPPHCRQLISLPSRSHDACGPTFGCAVDVGHAAIFQLHRLSILKGKRFCNESNACLSLELRAREGSLMGAACPPSPFCTVTWWMYAVVPSSSWITCPSSSFSPMEIEMEKSGPGPERDWKHLPVFSGGLSEIQVTFSRLPHSLLPRPEPWGTPQIPTGGATASITLYMPSKVGASNLTAVAETEEQRMPWNLERTYGSKVRYSSK